MALAGAASRSPPGLSDLVPCCCDSSAGNELRQVLLTLGVALVLDDLALVIWGGDTFTVQVPEALLQGPFGSA